MASLVRLIEEGHSQRDIGTFLDGLNHEERLEEMYEIPGSWLDKLFQMATPDLAVEDLIPKDYTPLREVIFYGKNSLPCFNRFQKRMCRSQDRSELWGYNHQSLQKITGPGSFVVRANSDRPGEVLIDYTSIPPSGPTSWPKPQPNECGITRLVYGHMKDYMRRVSSHIIIGEATKKGKNLGQYFVLCRPSLS